MGLGWEGGAHSLATPRSSRGHLEAAPCRLEGPTSLITHTLRWLQVFCGKGALHLDYTHRKFYFFSVIIAL